LPLATCHLPLATCHLPSVQQQTFVLLVLFEFILHFVFSFPVFQKLLVRNMHLTLTVHSDVRDGAIGPS
jgi:hypothetical protein